MNNIVRLGNERRTKRIISPELTDIIPIVRRRSKGRVKTVES